MVKLMGIVLAFAGCTAVGFLKASDLRQREKLLLDFKELLLHISTEISYFKEPLPQIFERLSAEFCKDGRGSDRETGLLLRNCLTAYRTEGVDMDRLWKNAVDFVYEDLPVTQRDTDIMKKCGDFLGQSDFAGQREHFLMLNHQLDRQIEQAAREADTKGKMYSRLGISAGTVLAIVLI